MRRIPVLVFAVVVAMALASFAAGQGKASRYLFVWAGDADGRESDFLAVVDVDPQSKSYRSVIATRPVDARGTRPHHTEYEMPTGGILWANGFAAGRTFLFDLHDPAHPAIAQTFEARGAFSHPHSYARLANGHLLTTFQQSAVAATEHGGHGEGSEQSKPAAAKEPTGEATGGLVEFDASGRVLRSVSAATPADPDIRPYSLAVIPALDRVVTTSSDMHLQVKSRAIQIWRLSDLKLLKTISLPPGSRGDENYLTAEPRLLGDGKTVLVNTFTCGLYRVNGLASDDASVEWIYSTPWKESTQRRFCAVPAVSGHFWIQTSGYEHAVITLDVSDPAHPREVSRLSLASDAVPHWIALEPSGDRAVITGYESLESQVLLANVDRTTGRLTLAGDAIDFGRNEWPHGASGKAIPHGAVFNRP
jgi:hypothetical protein